MTFTTLHLSSFLRNINCPKETNKIYYQYTQLKTKQNYFTIRFKSQNFTIGGTNFRLMN